jgi:hypothetical protein
MPPSRPGLPWPAFGGNGPDAGVFTWLRCVFAGWRVQAVQPRRIVARALKESAVAIVLLILLLALILAGVGFAVHLLWIAAIVVFAVWLLGWLIGAAEGGGRRRWYRRY